MVASLPGAMFSLTATIAVPPSVKLYIEAPKVTDREFCASTLIMVTVASSVVPPATPTGRFPKPSFTLSPISSRLSCAASTVKLFSVSVALNVTLGGTE